MNTPRAKQPKLKSVNEKSTRVDDEPPAVAQTTPKGVGYGHPEYHFVSAIMEMQKSLGEINSSISSLNVSLNSTKSKVDSLVEWKQWLIGGAVVGGLMMSAIAYIVTKAWDHIAIKAPTHYYSHVVPTPQYVQPTQQLQHLPQNPYPQQVQTQPVQSSSKTPQGLQP